jgi:drug/metabolite transporter (DMT)-like permease
MAPASVWRGVGLILLAGLCFTIQDALAKHVAAAVPVLMVLMVRYVLQAGISAALLLPALPRERLRSRRIGLQLLRGLLLLGASTSAVYALKHLPLLVSLLAVIFYNERLGGAGWVLLLLSFAGTLLIVRPTGTPYGWAALYPFACMVLGALYQIVTSRLAHVGEDPTATHLLSMATCALLFSLTAPLSWSPVDSMASWGWLALMSAAGAAGHLFVAHAYRYAPATVLAPYTYGSLGWAVLAGWLVFGHVPDGWTWTGIALILGCGLASTRLRQGGR